MSFQIGQRWFSQMEPELGLGIINEIGQRTVHIHFPAGKCKRQYAVSSAPIKRVKFRPGDEIHSRNGRKLIIEKVEVENELFNYIGSNGSLSETEICDTLSFTTPQDRLLSGFLDASYDFQVRFQVLKHYSAFLTSSFYGFIGSRIDLIPHQLYIAQEVSQRPVPRVLLSDETGLGKTIEACLILRRLLLSGRIIRVLILVPEALIHQWFVELLRKFNLLFRIMDEGYYHSIKNSEPDINSFFADQLCICAMEFFEDQNEYSDQCIHAEWDLVIVDEAHHLTTNSASFQLVKRLSEKVKGLMLLTATPQQLGHQSHFNRLQLLDPERYYDFRAFENENAQYRSVASLVNKLLSHQKINDREKQFIQHLIPDFSYFDKKHSRMQIIEHLLDRYGLGRVMFRNTRITMAGFPQRKVNLFPLQGDSQSLESVTDEVIYEIENVKKKVSYDYSRDARISWLVSLIRQLKKNKILVLCRSCSKVNAIFDALRMRIKTDMALFHENLTLIQRDKNAAWFAKREGAQVLISSELGSEGRNFQFVHHLVLFDLPIDPERLEQRIGRLDRIGQKETINIYIPYLEKSPQEILARWYHEGLHAFEKNVSGAYELYQRLGSRLKDQIMAPANFEAFIRETRHELKKVASILENGRDRLLELHSFNNDVAEGIIQEMKKIEQEKHFNPLVKELFGLFGVRLEASDHYIYHVNFELLEYPDFPIPVFREGYLRATFDRRTAVIHEDVEFLSWDHPMVTGTVDLLLGSEKGNASIVSWKDADSDEMLLEAIFILGCTAPQSMHVERFLPPIPIRIVVNHLMKNRTENYTSQYISNHIREGVFNDRIKGREMKDLITGMIKQANIYSGKYVEQVIKLAVDKMEKVLQNEIHRLVYLKTINPNVRGEEIRILEIEKKELKRAILKAQPRLDALRLIVHF